MEKNSQLYISTILIAIYPDTIIIIVIIETEARLFRGPGQELEAEA